MVKDGCSIVGISKWLVSKDEDARRRDGVIS